MDQFQTVLNIQFLIDIVNMIPDRTVRNEKFFFDIFVARSLKEFQELIFKKISKIDGVLSTETSLMVDLVKDAYDWGTAWD